MRRRTEKMRDDQGEARLVQGSLPASLCDTMAGSDVSGCLGEVKYHPRRPSPRMTFSVSTPCRSNCM